MTTPGSFVTWSGGYGQVDLVVSSGRVPGVATPISGRPDAPLARVDVWIDGVDGWVSSGTKAVVPVGDLMEIPAPTARHEQATPAARLVALVAAHDQLAAHLNLPPWARPSGVAVKAVFDRGRDSWPGGGLTGLGADEWALARVEAFLAVAAGVELAGYRRDLDLLPQSHPARAGEL